MKKLLVLFFVLGALPLCAIPRQVLLVRHAEKPDKGPHLSPKGKERAEALAPFFMTTPALTHHGNPVAIFAQRSTGPHNSMRSEETMKPLADALHMSVNKKYARKDAADCAKEILENHDYHGKKVIACFQHDALGTIAHKLGVHPHPTWPHGVYDIVWIVDFDDHGKAKLKTIHQKLLYGDSSSH